MLRLDEEELRFEVEDTEPRAQSTNAAPTALLDLSYLIEVAGGDVSLEETAANGAALEIVRGP